jgi:hypothetical protein
LIQQLYDRIGANSKLAITPIASSSFHRQPSPSRDPLNKSSHTPKASKDIFDKKLAAAPEIPDHKGSRNAHPISTRDKDPKDKDVAKKPKATVDPKKKKVEKKSSVTSPKKRDEIRRKTEEIKKKYFQGADDHRRQKLLSDVRTL